MNVSIVILQQILAMALYMLMGYLLFKYKKITAEGSKTIASMLLYLVIPGNIINGFCVEFSMSKLKDFGISFFLALLVLGIAMLAARLIYRDKIIEDFSAAFSNAGFIGIPLIKNSLGNEAVFYLVGMIMMLNVFQLIYGAARFAGRKKTMRELLSELAQNPIIIGSIAGFLIFVSGLGNNLPVIFQSCIEGIAALNAPLAMIVLGVYLAQTDLKSLVISKQLYVLSMVRLLLIPLLTLAVLSVIPVSGVIKMTLMIAASAPVGANVAVYAQLYERDYIFACKTVTQSTVLSIVTLPIVIALAGFFIS